MRCAQEGVEKLEKLSKRLTTEIIQKLLHKKFGGVLKIVYLCIVNEEVEFTPWAARKIFLAGKENLPTENVNDDRRCDAKNY